MDAGTVVVGAVALGIMFVVFRLVTPEPGERPSTNVPNDPEPDALSYFLMHEASSLDAEPPTPGIDDDEDDDVLTVAYCPPGFEPEDWDDLYVNADPPAPEESMEGRYERMLDHFQEVPASLRQEFPDYDWDAPSPRSGAGMERASGGD